jgi:hypothetical protein
MPELLLSIFRFVRLLLSGHQAVAIENAALRLQLAAFRRRRKRPVLTVLDTVFWTTLRSLWPGWCGTLLHVQPDTVVSLATRALSPVLGAAVNGTPSPAWSPAA